MRFKSLAATILVVAGYVFACVPGHAADLIWEVENPFRFFKRTSSFDMYERAYAAVRGNPGNPLPDHIIWKTERRLNDPDCKDSTSPDACQRTARARYEISRQGWAAQTVDFTCYDRNARPRRYMTTCDRQYSWGTAKEDYVLPDAHTVVLHLAPERLTPEVASAECTWTWHPRRAGGAGETRKQACKDKFVIKRVPFSTDKTVSGAVVSVKLPSGEDVSENVIVEDLFIVAFGDSFMSGEGNPDKPVVLSATREMVYDPTNTGGRENQEMAKAPLQNPNYGVASARDDTDPKSLPKRRMEDEERGLIYKPNSAEFERAFAQREAQWLSVDCHRSQYGYPFRVSLQLALENRHRAVTLVSLACSGSDIVEGLFDGLDAREHPKETTGGKVAAQFDQLSDLICRNGSAGRTAGGSYALPVYSQGSTSIGERTFTKRWCAPQNRKRSIDLAFLSIGGNDVGFSSLVMYAMTESAGDLAPIASLVGSQIRFAPDVSRAYLNVLDRRMKAVKAALSDGFGIDASRVLQTAYEPIQYDETGGACGLQPTLGLDVHPKFAYNRNRVIEVSNFAHEMDTRLACIADARRPGCPQNLVTGAGTGFKLIADHVPEFAKRGMCSRDPRRAFADQMAMAMPRKSHTTDEFVPYSPAAWIPYAAHWRLVRDPNDSFLTANTHREGISLFDILQPTFASLYSGAFHPTAEGHSIVADHVVKHARELLEKRAVAQN